MPATDKEFYKISEEDVINALKGVGQPLAKSRISQRIQVLHGKLDANPDWAYLKEVIDKMTKDGKLKLVRTAKSKSNSSLVDRYSLAE